MLSQIWLPYNLLNHLDAFLQALNKRYTTVVCFVRQLLRLFVYINSMRTLHILVQICTLASSHPQVL